MLLAMDTSTSLIGAACIADDVVLSEVTVADARHHGEWLTPIAQQAVDQSGKSFADVDTVAVGVGPGPFTGLRVGIVTGLVMARVRGIPVVGVCSLDALGAAALEWCRDRGQAITTFVVATDARRAEVYWARYVVDAERIRRIGEPAVSRPHDVPEHVRALPTFGRGPLLYPQWWPVISGAPVDVGPAALGRLAGDPRYRRLPEPLYLRRPDAKPLPPPAFSAEQG